MVENQQNIVQKFQNLFKVLEQMSEDKVIKQEHLKILKEKIQKNDPTLEKINENYLIAKDEEILQTDIIDYINNMNNFLNLQQQNLENKDQPLSPQQSTQKIRRTMRKSQTQAPHHVPLLPQGHYKQSKFSKMKTNLLKQISEEQVSPELKSKMIKFVKQKSYIMHEQEEDENSQLNNTLQSIEDKLKDKLDKHENISEQEQTKIYLIQNLLKEIKVESCKEERYYYILLYKYLKSSPLENDLQRRFQGTLEDDYNNIQEKFQKILRNMQRMPSVNLIDEEKLIYALALKEFFQMTEFSIFNPQPDTFHYYNSKFEDSKIQSINRNDAVCRMKNELETMTVNKLYQLSEVSIFSEVSENQNNSLNIYGIKYQIKDNPNNKCYNFFLFKIQKSNDPYQISFAQSFIEILKQANMDWIFAQIAQIQEQFALSSSYYFNHTVKESILEIRELLLIASSQFFLYRAQNLCQTIFKAEMQLFNFENLYLKIYRVDQNEPVSPQRKSQMAYFSIDRLHFFAYSDIIQSVKINENFKFVKQLHYKWKWAQAKELEWSLMYRLYLSNPRAILLHFDQNGDLVFCNRTLNEDFIFQIQNIPQQSKLASESQEFVQELSPQQKQKKAKVSFYEQKINVDIFLNTQKINYRQLLYKVPSMMDEMENFLKGKSSLDYTFYDGTNLSKFAFHPIQTSSQIEGVVLVVEEIPRQSQKNLDFSQKSFYRHLIASKSPQASNVSLIQKRYELIELQKNTQNTLKKMEENLELDSGIIYYGDFLNQQVPQYKVYEPFQRKGYRRSLSKMLQCLDLEVSQNDNAQLLINKQQIQQNQDEIQNEKLQQSKISLRHSQEILQANPFMINSEMIKIEPLLLPIKEVITKFNNFSILNQLDFNVFDLSLQEKYGVIFAILKKSEFFSFFNVQEDRFIKFLEPLYYYYSLHKNPFHNFNHGISVMQCCYYFTQKKSVTNLLQKRELLTLIFSGLCHDIGHTGKSNIFECNIVSDIALQYHDISVLEQYHIFLSFSLFYKQKEFQLFEYTKQEDLRMLRKFFIKNILSTDMKEHFPISKKIQDRQDQAFIIQNFCKTEEDQLLFSSSLLHSADWTGAIKPFKLAQQWSTLVNQEFMAQYNQELLRNIPVTPYYKDLDNIIVMAKAEKGFLQVFVLPYYQIVEKFFINNELGDAIHNIKENIKQWEAIIVNEEAKKLQQ